MSQKVVTRVESRPRAAGVRMDREEGTGDISAEEPTGFGAELGLSKMMTFRFLD